MGDRPDVISAHDTVSVLVARDPRAARILLNHGMHCVGCAIAPFETLAEVCAVYGLPLESLLDELRHRSSAMTPSPRKERDDACAADDREGQRPDR
jgi:hybrid cluster-associated redox disulfide protein